MFQSPPGDSDGSCSTGIGYLATTRGIPREKINLGVPFWGKKYSTYDINQSFSGTVEDMWYHEIVPLIGNGWSYHWDSNAFCPYLIKDDESKIITFDNPESIGFKCEYAKTQNLGGVMIWALGYDIVNGGQELIQSIGENYLKNDSENINLFPESISIKAYPNPLDYADVVTSTTHKVLRGPRGGIILTNKEELIKKFNSAIFPGLQGGPLMHVIAAKAAGFLEALRPDFKVYIKSVLSNAKILAETLKNNGFKIYSGGTDTHLMLVDLRPFNVKGNLASESLCRANITCNKNGIPFDTESPMITSGIRLGSQAATTRGFGLKEFEVVGQLITKVIKGLSSNPEDNSKVENEVRQEVIELCSKFPIYKHLG